MKNLTALPLCQRVWLAPGEKKVKIPKLQGGALAMWAVTRAGTLSRVLFTPTHVRPISQRLGGGNIRGNDRASF